MKKNKILIWGGGSQSRILQAMLVEKNIGEISLIFDESISALNYDTSAQFTNSPIELHQHIPLLTHYVVAIGNEFGYARYMTARSLETFGLMPIQICHQNAYIDSGVQLGSGCQIMPGAIIHKFVEIGSDVIINTGAVVDHECKIGNGVHVMGSAAIAGKVCIGDYATIGTNSTILPSINVGKGAYVGAGAVVLEDVADYAVVVGSPARYVRNAPEIFWGADFGSSA